MVIESKVNKNKTFLFHILFIIIILSCNGITKLNGDEKIEISCAVLVSFVSLFSKIYLKQRKSTYIMKTEMIKSLIIT